MKAPHKGKHYTAFTHVMPSHQRKTNTVKKHWPTAWMVCPAASPVTEDSETDIEASPALDSRSIFSLPGLADERGTNVPATDTLTSSFGWT